MKNKFLLLAIPTLFLAACSGSADKASKKQADSIAAVAQKDSLLNAAKMMHKQDSIDAAKKDTTKQTESK